MWNNNIRQYEPITYLDSAYYLDYVLCSIYLYATVLSLLTVLTGTVFVPRT